ncbi:MAG: malonic semialdehyde reductase [Lautropia sp.]|nr:malonic semialdehyde reductase [Lautropia sp.]
MIDQNSIDALFNSARTQNGWVDQPVTDPQLKQIYDLAKMAPTSANAQPARILFLRSQEAKERLRPALSPGNLAKTMAAPVVAIVGYDLNFHERLPQVFPHNPDMKKGFDGDANLAKRQIFAFRNGTLSGAYLIMAIRAIGLGAGPMSGFDNAAVDKEFFPDGTIKSNFLCNIGVGDPSKVMGRLPRLSFDEACKIL